MPAFSVLDLSPIASGSSAREAVARTIALAVHAETIGARRFWVAEHHNAASLASSAPEILIGPLAAATRTLRVGTGGTMLPNHAPLKVAETFRVLGALHPGRIDLGLGRAPGTDPRTARALRRHVEVDPASFGEQLEELLALLREESGPRPPRPTNIVAIPVGVPAPDIFILSSGDHGAPVAGAHGLGFAFAHHMSPDDAAREVARYRAAFEPSRERSEPYAIVSTHVVCADSDDEAEALASSGRLALVRMMQGQRDLPLASVEEAMAHPYDDEERAVLAAFEGRTIVGGPDRVAKSLAALVEEVRPDEVMVLSFIHDAELHRRSNARVAELLRGME